MPLHCETVHFAAAKKEMVGQKNNKGSRPNSDCNMSWNKYSKKSMDSPIWVSLGIRGPGMEVITNNSTWI